MSEIVTAVATPFAKGRVDVQSFAKLVDYQNKNAVDKLLLAGTTGEGMLLSPCEKRLLVSVAKEICNRPIWLGVDGANTVEVVKQIERYNNFGVDGYLLCPPTFCKCTATGFVEHVKQLQKATNLPIVLYNAPSRCGYNLPISSLKALADIDVFFLKDAGSDVNYRKKLPKNIDVYCGNDTETPTFADMGITKTVSVVSNIAPQLTRCVLQKEVTGKEECFVGKSNNFDECKEQFLMLSKLSFLQTNPIAIKYMLYKMGIFATYDVRLPLTKASAKTRKTICEVWL